MINGLYHTKAEGVNDILLNILKNRDHDAIRDTGGHAKTVATAFAQFLLNIVRMATCLHVFAKYRDQKYKKRKKIKYKPRGKRGGK